MDLGRRIDNPYEGSLHVNSAIRKPLGVTKVASICTFQFDLP